MQKLIAFLPAMLLVILVSPVLPGKNEHKTRRIFFTTANIWYEKANDIPSTNYHKGRMLPIGTMVTKVSIRDGHASGRVSQSSVLAKKPDSMIVPMDITFEDEHGEKFVITFLKKHASSTMTVRDYFRQYFSREDPLREGGPVQQLTDAEKENVKNGVISIGMSKEAVLMAYGYPPSHRTPSIEDDHWIYWISRVSQKEVFFADGKVVQIK
ncbi:MAG TPA: hypothetical protein VL197_08080 [Nitrospirota bacterium]|nr:hypothetical protein [Nitrospirota bacterium]